MQVYAISLFREGGDASMLLKPGEIKSFLIKYFEFPERIKILENNEMMYPCFVICFSKGRKISLLWEPVTLKIIFEGYITGGKEKNCLRKARIFFSENYVYPTQEGGKLIFSIERNLFIERVREGLSEY